MSSLFSYELDEAQIRLTLQNSKAVKYNESMWNEFEKNYLVNNLNQNHSKFKLPEFHLNINRNVVLPAAFILALVGISAIMLSFVDFETNAPQQVEKGLIPNPDNFKPSNKKTTISTPTVIEKVAKSNTINSMAALPIDKKLANLDSVVAINLNTISLDSGIQINKPNLAQKQALDSTSTSKVENQPIIGAVNPNPSLKSKRKRRKIPTEQIESIKAPSLIGLETVVKEEEPELEIKFN